MGDTTVLDTLDFMVDTDFPSSMSRPRLLRLRPVLRRPGRSVRPRPTPPSSTPAMLLLPTDTAMDFTPDMLLPGATPDTTVLDTPDLDMDTMVLDTPDILMDMSSSPWRRPPMRPSKKPKKSTRNNLG